MNTQHYRHKYDLRIQLFYTLLKKGEKKTFFLEGEKKVYYKVEMSTTKN